MITTTTIVSIAYTTGPAVLGYYIIFHFHVKNLFKTRLRVNGESFNQEVDNCAFVWPGRVTVASTFTHLTRVVQCQFWLFFTNPFSSRIHRLALRSGSIESYVSSRRTRVVQNVTRVLRAVICKSYGDVIIPHAYSSLRTRTRAPPGNVYRFLPREHDNTYGENTNTGVHGRNTYSLEPYASKTFAFHVHENGLFKLLMQLCNASININNAR